MWLMTHMRFETMDPCDIQANPWNSNVVSHENEEKLRASIERHGMFKPVIVRELPDGTIESVGGWHRAEQAIELGYTEIPVCNLGVISDEKAKEISLADNARFGIDDTLKLSEILEGLDAAAMENVLPWTTQDIRALTASLAVDIDDLDLDQPVINDQEDEPEEPAAPKTVKTHQIIRFRCSIQDAARISNAVNQAMQDQGFTKEDDLTNAGDALAFLLFQDQEDDDAAV
jgi:ParB-like chromosome segregation protein Spo0J